MPGGRRDRAHRRTLEAVLAGEANLLCKMIVPSDLTSKWLGWGVEKIRDLFDWALKQPSCLLVIDELDGVAPQRTDEGGMHTDERRQVNELLAQLDRIVGKPVSVVATTNYMRGIDNAVRRSGRFDVKVPVFPPDHDDRRELFRYYLSRPGVSDVQGVSHVDVDELASETLLFSCSDIATVVQSAVRAAVLRSDDSRPPALATDDLLGRIRMQPRSLRANQVAEWLEEARGELGDLEQLEHLGRFMWVHVSNRPTPHPPPSYAPPPSAILYRGTTSDARPRLSRKRRNVNDRQVRTKRIRFFMTTEDEREFSQRLLEATPRIAFIEATRADRPKSVPSIADATSLQVLLHDGPVQPDASWKELGPAIQLTRSKEREGLGLREGELAIVVDGADERFDAFVRATWQTLRRMTTNRLETYNPVAGITYRTVNDMHLAAHAAAWHEQGGVLAGNAANLYYRPRTGE